MAAKKSATKKSSAAKQAVKAAENNDPRKAETVTEAEAGVQRDDPGTLEIRAGLATGSQSGHPDNPDGLVIDQTIVPSSPDEDTDVKLSVVQTAEGKKGPAA